MFILMHSIGWLEFIAFVASLCHFAVPLDTVISIRFSLTFSSSASPLPSITLLNSCVADFVFFFVVQTQPLPSKSIFVLNYFKPNSSLTLKQAIRTSLQTCLIPTFHPHLFFSSITTPDVLKEQDSAFRSVP